MLLRAAGTTAALLLVVCQFSVFGRSADNQAEPPPSQHRVPAGYKFHDFVDFTDTPNHGLPHIRLHQEEQPRTAEPEEGWHTLLITADGRAYTKPIADSLEDLAAAGILHDFQPSIPESQGGSTSGSASYRRQLQQAVVPPSTSIGVSTSISDLSCDGCGPDNREQVTATTTYPWMTIGQLIGQLGTSTEGLECTGTLIGNKHVLTAAHCVFDINASRKMVSNLNFAPALNGNTAPYGTLQWTTARIVTQFSSQPSYTTTAMDYDFSLVTLATPADSGYLGLFVPPDNGVTDTVNLTTAGYPGSKPSGTMWSSACGATAIDYSTNNAFANVQQCADGGCSNILTHHCISSDGQSGSGIWDSNFQIRSILTGKVTTSNGDAYNVGTEIDTEVYNQIAAWYNEDGDTAGNGTLPLAPSGPGSQPATQNAFVRWWDDNWGKAWFIAVVVFIGLAVVGFGFLLLLCILRSCGCCCFNRRPKAVKAQSQSSGYPVAAAAGGIPPAARGSRGRAPPRPPQQAHPAGVSYDGTSGQFLVNGRPYGQYQHAYGGQQHGRSASTTPLVQ